MIDPADTPHRQDQKRVAFGIVTAWVVSIAFYWFGFRVMESTSVFTTWTPQDLAVLAVLLASLALILGIGLAAATRHFVSNIDGSKPTSGSRLDLILRYVSNTTEQLLLFAIASAGMASFTSAASLLPVAAVWFLIARLAFLIGYVKSPVARAFGFAATFHPTIVMTGFALWSALKKAL